MTMFRNWLDPFVLNARLLRVSFYGWLTFLCVLVAVGFYPFLYYRDFLTALPRGAVAMGAAMASALHSPGFFTGLFYSTKIAVIAFSLSFLISWLLNMNMPFFNASIKKQSSTRNIKERIIRLATQPHFITGLCFFWLAVPPLALLAGMDIFYGALSNGFPNPNGLHHVIVLVQKEVPFLLLVMFNARRAIQPGYHRQAAAIGMGGIAEYVKVEFPLMWPKIKWPCVLSLLFAFNNIETAIFLAPNAPPAFTILLLNSMQTELAIQQDQLHGFALWLLIANGCLVLLFLLVAWLVKQSRMFLFRLSLTDRCFPRFYYGGMVIFMLHGFLLLSAVLGSAAPSIINDVGDMPRSMIDAIVNSLFLGLASSFCAVFIFLWWRFNKLRIDGWAKYILLLPIFLPDTILALHGNILAFLLGGQKLALLFLLHGGMALGLAFLLLDGVYEKIPIGIMRHAQALGLKPTAIFFRVVIPWLWRPLLFSLALGLAVSVSLYTPNIILARDFDTMSALLMAYQFSGDRHMLAVASTWLLSLPMLGYGLAYYLSGIYDRKFA